MANRNPRRGRGQEKPQAGIAAVYEGPEVLSALLSRAGAPWTAGEAAARFARAQREGVERAIAIPALFPDEPRFGGPDEALRLYQNLFGLWARVAAGHGAEAGTPVPGRAGSDLGPRPPVPPPAADPLPERGATRGDRLAPGLVEAMWRHLDGLPPAEGKRLRHRFEAAQPDLCAWFAEVQVPESGAQAALDLLLELWAMMDHGFGDRLGTAGWTDLEELAAEPPALEADQPALAAYVAEQLDVVSDEDPAFGPGERAQVERLLATVAAALRRTLG